MAENPIAARKIQLLRKIATLNGVIIMNKLELEYLPLISHNLGLLYWQIRRIGNIPSFKHKKG
jgi:hypothetical protein